MTYLLSWNPLFSFLFQQVVYCQVLNNKLFRGGRAHVYDAVGKLTELRIHVKKTTGVYILVEGDRQQSYNTTTTKIVSHNKIG